VPIVAPFRGLVFSSSRVPELERAIAPPADTLPEESRASWRARSPHNILHLDAPEGDEAGRHALAAARLADWRRDGVLEQDVRPAFYVAAIKYRARGMPERTLWGFLARLLLDETNASGIRPVEASDTGARQALLESALALRAHATPLVGLYPDAGGDVSRVLETVGRRPADRWAADDAGMDLRLWRVADRGVVRTLGLALRPLPLWIVEGADRYASALDLRDRLLADDPGAPPGSRTWHHTLAFLTGLESPGLTLAPYHRVLKGARRFNARSLGGGPAAQLFDVKHFSFEGYDHRGEQIRRRLREAAARGRTAIAVYGGGADFSLYLLAGDTSEGVLGALPEPLRKMDVAVLEASLLVWARGMTHAEDDSGAVRLAESVEKAMALVDAGEGSAAFLVNVPGRDALTAIADAGLTLPHRSVCLLPRVPSGLVIDVLDPVDEVHPLPDLPEPEGPVDEAE
jgi:uncharacterized protein (DUF1015 family)